MVHLSMFEGDTSYLEIHSKLGKNKIEKINFTVQNLPHIITGRERLIQTLLIRGST